MQRSDTMHSRRGRCHGSAGDGGRDGRSEKRLFDAAHAELLWVKSGLDRARAYAPKKCNATVPFHYYCTARAMKARNFLCAWNTGSPIALHRLMPTMALIESSD